MSQTIKQLKKDLLPAKTVAVWVPLLDSGPRVGTYVEVSKTQLRLGLAAFDSKTQCGYRVDGDCLFIRFE